MNPCPACGAENRPTAKFCHQCGGRLALMTEQAPPMSPENALPAEMAPEGATPPESGKSTSDTDSVAIPDSSPLQLVAVGDDLEHNCTKEDALASAMQPSDIADRPDDDLPEPAPIDLQVAESLVSVRDDTLLPADVNSEEIGFSEGDDAPSPQPGKHGAASWDGGRATNDRVSLAPGDVIADRFVIQAVTAQENGEALYLAEDRGVCPTCHALVKPTEEEPYCFECGAYLLASDLQRPIRRLQRYPADEQPDSVEILREGDLLYRLLPPDAPSTAAEGDPDGFDGFPKGVHLLAGQRSDVGVARTERPDEDSLFALTLSAIYESRSAPSLGCYLVADGMGGHGDGEVASRLVVETISSSLLQSVLFPLLQGKVLAQETIEALLDTAIQLANRLVRQAATARGNDMGATLTLALMLDRHALIANVGDSRTYLWRGGMLQQITEDHSAVYQLYRAGTLSEAEIYTHPRRNEITRNMGFRTTVQADYFHVDLLPGDTLLLCCDGLWEMLHNDGIADVFLVNYGDPQQICDELIKRANQAGGEDNISVIVARVLA